MLGAPECVVSPESTVGRNCCTGRDTKEEVAYLKGFPVFRIKLLRETKQRADNLCFEGLIKVEELKTALNHTNVHCTTLKNLSGNNVCCETGICSNTINKSSSEGSEGYVDVVTVVFRITNLSVGINRRTVSLYNELVRC